MTPEPMSSAAVRAARKSEAGVDPVGRRWMLAITAAIAAVGLLRAL